MIKIIYDKKILEIEKDILTEEFEVLKLYFEDTNQNDLCINSKEEFNFWEKFLNYKKYKLPFNDFTKVIDGLYFLEKYESKFYKKMVIKELESNVINYYCNDDRDFIVNLIQTYDRFENLKIFSYKVLFNLWNEIVDYECGRYFFQKSFLETLKNSRTLLCYAIIVPYYYPKIKVNFKINKNMDNSFVKCIVKEVVDSYFKINTYVNGLSQIINDAENNDDDTISFYENIEQIINERCSIKVFGR